jgi:hypothetical protein
MQAAPREFQQQKKVIVKFYCGSTQRKRLIHLIELNYNRLLSIAKSLMGNAEYFFKIFKDQNFEEEFIESDFSDYAQLSNLKTLRVYIKVYSEIEWAEETMKKKLKGNFEQKIEFKVIEKQDNNSGEKAKIADKSEQIEEKKEEIKLEEGQTLNENEEKLVNLFEFLMKQDLVKKFIKKKIDNLDEISKDTMPDSEKKDVMISVLDNILTKN